MACQGLKRPFHLEHATYRGACSTDSEQTVLILPGLTLTRRGSQNPLNWDLMLDEKDQNPKAQPSTVKNVALRIF